MAGDTLTSTEYIQHHLTNWTYGKYPDGHWGFAHSSAEATDMGFWAIHVDSMLWSILLGTLFLLIFHKAAKSMTAGTPRGLQNFVEWVVDFVNENNYFDTPYNPDDPSSPVCWSVSKNKTIDMTPSESAVKIQHNDCASCWANEFGSATTGRGKACRNSRRLAIIAVSDLNNLDSAEVAYTKVPPTSIKSFDKVGNDVRKIFKRPMYGVVTEIKFDSDSDFEKLLFKVVKPISDAATITGIKKIKEAIKEEIMLEPDPANYKEAAPVKNSGKNQRGKSSKKKVSKKKR